MCNINLGFGLSAFCLLSFLLCSCSTYTPPANPVEPTPTKVVNSQVEKENYMPDYAARLPKHINTGGGKTVLVDPNVHAWGAYGADGNLERAGLATAGSDWCPDLHRRCHTKAGTFHVNSLGSADCISHIFPIPRGGAPMPYCMFFNGGQGLHGSDELVEGNISHGCVRMPVEDAEWLRYNFVNVGTKVVVRPY